MIIVPIKNDLVTPKDSSDQFVVSSYTNLKDEPAVYLTNNDILYFSNIEDINGVKVKYNQSSKMFDSLGPIKRSLDFLQPTDSISVKVIDENSSVSEILTKEIKKLVLHVKKKISHGLIIHTEDDEVVNLSEVVTIILKSGKELPINTFKKKYIDYFPIA